MRARRIGGAARPRPSRPRNGDRARRTVGPLVGVACVGLLALSACSGTDTTQAGGATTTAGGKAAKDGKAPKEGKEAKEGKPAKDTTGGTEIPQKVLLDNYLVRNAAAPEPGTFPKAYRAVALAAKNPPEGINAQGLADLNVSGSGQMTPAHIDSIKAETGGSEILDLDLRAESHGFVNDDAISWYSPRDWSMVGLTPAQILDAERERLATLTPGSKVELIDGKEKVDGSFVTGQTAEVTVNTVTSEEQLASSKGMRYERITVDDHVPMAPEQLDRVVEIYKDWRSHPGSRLHVHCAGGDGRTTTVLVAVDILANGGTVSVDDIVARQAKLGEGTDVFSTGKPDSPFYYQYKGRAEQVRKFYEWARSHPGGEGQSFSAWLAANR